MMSLVVNCLSLVCFVKCVYQDNSALKIHLKSDQHGKTLSLDRDT